MAACYLTCIFVVILFYGVVTLNDAVNCFDGDYKSLQEKNCSYFNTECKVTRLRYGDDTSGSILHYSSCAHPRECKPRQQSVNPTENGLHVVKECCCKGDLCNDQAFASKCSHAVTIHSFRTMIILVAITILDTLKVLGSVTKTKSHSTDTSI